MANPLDWMVSRYHMRKEQFLSDLALRYDRRNFMESIDELVPKQPAEKQWTCPPLREPSLGYVWRRYVLQKIPEQYKRKGF